MLNVFPNLLVYSFFAPLILRVIVGIVFINLGLVSLKGEKERWLLSLSALRVPNPKLVLKIIAGIEIACGIALILGFYTQVAALVLAIFTFKGAYIEYREPAILKRSLVFYTLLLGITLSLLLTGAGAFSIDLPL